MDEFEGLNSVRELQGGLKTLFLEGFIYSHMVPNFCIGRTSRPSLSLAVLPCLLAVLACHKLISDYPRVLSAYIYSY